MLRYFYLLVCIQLCFCSDYIDNSGIDSLDRRIVRSKNARVHKKQTRSPKKSGVVQFDVENFMRPEDTAIDYDPYRYEVQSKRRAPEKYEDEFYDVTTENIKTKNKLAEYSHLENIHEAPTRIPAKEVHGKHFNFQTLAFEDRVAPATDKKEGKIGHAHEKPNSNFYRKLAIQEPGPEHPESKCSFRSMKIPFFSSSKSSTSLKPALTKKKRRMFCFNCRKKTYTHANEDLKDAKDHAYISKIEGKKYHRLSKRDYADMCPKCVKEMLVGLRKKTKETETTTIVGHKLALAKESPAVPKNTKPVLVEKPQSFDTHLLGDFYYNFIPYIREKRSDVIEQEEVERERRLKELEEVEKRIDNVRVTAPSFTRLTLNIAN